MKQEIGRMDAGAGARGGGAPLAWRAQTIKVHAVQCAKCGKFRSIPCKRLYERIRADILERPWVCEDAIQWNAKVNCELPDAFEGNSHFVLTMDKPGVPATPAGWDRSVHIRAGPGNEHFSDIFYFAPGNASVSARRLRSMKGVERYLPYSLFIHLLSSLQNLDSISFLERSIEFDYISSFVAMQIYRQTSGIVSQIRRFAERSLR